MLTLLNAAAFFGLALLAAIFISANRRATERRRRKKRAQQIKQRLQGEAIDSYRSGQAPSNRRTSTICPRW
jgi:hypothetical protein